MTFSYNENEMNLGGIFDLFKEALNRLSFIATLKISLTLAHARIIKPGSFGYIYNVTVQSVTK